MPMSRPTLSPPTQASQAHYIVLGSGIPEGDTVYVLSMNTNDSVHTVFNASTGDGYLTSDRRCPLKDIALVVSADQIWGNIQDVGEPHKVLWDFDNKAR